MRRRADRRILTFYFGHIGPILILLHCSVDCWIRTRVSLLFHVDVVVVEFQCLELEILPLILPRIKLHGQL
jgi:hypothetical protein